MDVALQSPFKFQAHHTAIREPFDYYKWGNDFFRPLIIMGKSRLLGIENIKKIDEATNRGENVLILSNHQTEVDPQAISILLEREGYEKLAEKIIFIAGHKVTNDPIAIPFSMGRNLICIHSKKHIKNPPEGTARLIQFCSLYTLDVSYCFIFKDVPKKQAQNMESMAAMGSLIGSVCLLLDLFCILAFSHPLIFFIHKFVP